MRSATGRSAASAPVRSPEDQAARNASREAARAGDCGWETTPELADVGARFSRSKNVSSASTVAGSPLARKDAAARWARAGS